MFLAVFLLDIILHQVGLSQGGVHGTNLSKAVWKTPFNHNGLVKESTRCKRFGLNQDGGLCPEVPLPPPKDRAGGARP